MRIIWPLVAFVLMAGVSVLYTQEKRGSLYGWVVVIDPGHGGMDPGSSGSFSGERVVEDEYVYDVALRVFRLVKARQGLAFLTIRDKTGERNWRPQDVFPDERTETFAWDGTVVRARTAGLLKRLFYGNTISRRYPRHRQAWISIHFDVLVGNRDIEGVRIIAPDVDLRVAKALEKSFGNARRLRDGDSVVTSGDSDHGLRRLFILSSRNRIREKVLLELGNFNNEADVWRIRNPAVREAYAKAIVQALEQW